MTSALRLPRTSFIATFWDSVVGVFLDMLSSHESGAYVDLDTSFRTLLSQLSETPGRNGTKRFVISCDACKLVPGSGEWCKLKDEILKARARGVQVVVYFRSDPQGTIEALAAERYEDKPLITKVELEDTTRFFYGRVVGGFIVEHQENRGICGEGAFLRIRDSILARSIEVGLLRLAEQYHRVDPMSELEHY